MLILIKLHTVNMYSFFTPIMPQQIGFKIPHIFYTNIVFILNL